MLLKKVKKILKAFQESVTKKIMQDFIKQSCKNGSIELIFSTKRFLADPYSVAFIIEYLFEEVKKYLNFN